MALANARMAARAGNGQRAEKRPYECGRCNGGWHLTSMILSTEETA